jgi:hypothetical protein
MNIVISNKSKIGLGRVKVTNNNPIAKVNFGKIAKITPGSILLSTLGDVNVTDQKNGDVLVYNSDTNSYYIETLPDIDGGTF